MGCCFWKECGISGVMFEGYNENIYRLCKEAGLEAHYWKWTMNRRELLNKHPDWYAVNSTGESCHDKPAYVDYYRFLCPNHQGVAEYLAEDYVKEAHKPYVDGVHLDYLPPAWEGSLASAADVVFAASPELAERLSPCSGNIALLPNGVDRKSTRLNSSHSAKSRMPSSA